MKTLEEARREFEEKVPWMRRMVSPFFRNYNPEAREEAIQNTLGLCWLYITRLIAQGRDDVTLKQVLWHSMKGTRAGRKPQGKQAKKAKDVFDNAWFGRVKIENVNVYLYLGNADPIPDVVQTAIDWSEYLETLTDRQREILEDILFSRMRNQEIATKWNVTPGAVSQMRRRIVEGYRRFLGEEMGI